MIQSSHIEFSIDRSVLEGIKNMNNEIFPSHFLSVICGKPGSGKTSLLKFVLKSPDLLFKKFNKIYILSPSYKEFKSLFLPDENFTERLDFEWIENKIMPLKKTSEYINVLFIFDDLISDLHKNYRSKEITDFIFNRRHLLENGMISVIITSQKYRFVPTSIRSNITLLIAFKLNNIDMKQIKEELVFADENFDKVSQLIYNTENSFMVYRLDTDTYFKNFNKIIL